MTNKPSCQSTKVSVSPSCQSIKVVNQTKFSITQQLSVYLNGHVSKLSIMQQKLFITSHCQSIQIVHHLVSQADWQAHSDKFGMSVPKQNFRKINIIDLFSIIMLTLLQNQNANANLLVQSLRMNIFQQSLVWKILNKGWHTKQWLKNGIHITCIPQVWKAATKKLLYVWNVYCVMTNHEQEYTSFPYPVNATSFSNGFFLRDLKEIWLAKRDVWVIGRGGGIRPGPDVFLVDFL